MDMTEANKRAAIISDIRKQLIPLFVKMIERGLRGASDQTSRGLFQDLIQHIKNWNPGANA